MRVSVLVLGVASALCCGPLVHAAGAPVFFPIESVSLLDPMASGPAGGWSMDATVPAIQTDAGRFDLNDSLGIAPAVPSLKPGAADVLALDAGPASPRKGFFDALRVQWNGRATDLFGAPIVLESGNSLLRSGVVDANWQFAQWATLDLSAGHRLDVIGAGSGASALALPVARMSASAVRASAHVGLGNGWVTTFSYSEGVSQLSLRTNATSAMPQAVRERAYGFSVAKRGLFDGTDSLGLALSLPSYTGSSQLPDVGMGALKFGNGNGLTTTAPVPETDVELGYVTTFLDGAVALQANAGYQMNVDGIGGTSAVSVVSRAKINF
jgi:hypothetical protein